MLVRISPMYLQQIKVTYPTELLKYHGTELGNNLSWESTDNIKQFG